VKAERIKLTTPEAFMSAFSKYEDDKKFERDNERDKHDSSRQSFV
jgi:hypothetical protein